MSEKKGSPLAAGIVGFILGAIAVKLVERFCPMAGCCGRGAVCCCGDDEGCCCGDDEGGGEGCCCEGDGEDHESEAEADPAA